LTCRLARPGVSDAKVANRDVTDFGWVIAHAAVSRRPPISLDTMVPRTRGATRPLRTFGRCPPFKDHSLQVSGCGRLHPGQAGGELTRRTSTPSLAAAPFLTGSAGPRLARVSPCPAADCDRLVPRSRSFSLRRPSSRPFSPLSLFTPFSRSRSRPALSAASFFAFFAFFCCASSGWVVDGGCGESRLPREPEPAPPPVALGGAAPRGEIEAAPLVFRRSWPSLLRRRPSLPPAAVYITPRALSVTQRALSVTQRALSVHPASSQRHPASSQRHPASSQRHPASSQRHPASS
jgi:hypothetical protein